MPFEHNEWVVVMLFHFSCILEVAHIMVWFFIVMEILRNLAILVPILLNGSHFLTDALQILLVLLSKKYLEK